MSTISSNIISAIQKVIGTDPAILHEPCFEANELKYVSECITTGWVSSVGSFVNRFEEMLCEITGAKKAVACSNGTSALFICLKLAGVKSDDEVLIPALTFVATANAVSHCGAVPHLVDVEEKTLGIDVDRLRQYLIETCELSDSGLRNRSTNRLIKAIVPMHCFGHPSAMEAIVELASEFHLKVVEDAAESLGSYIGDRHTGTFGDIAAISFNGNKIVTTGGGGAIITNDVALGEKAKHLTTTAKVPHKWRFYHDEVGYNLRMPNINAALGCAQLEKLDEFVDCKRQLAMRYREVFSDCDDVSFVGEPEGCRSNYWLNALMLSPDFAGQRDTVLEATNAQKIMTRPSWELMNDLPMYAACPSMELSISRSIQSRLINIPSGVTVAKRSIQLRESLNP